MSPMTARSAGRQAVGAPLRFVPWSAPLLLSTNLDVAEPCRGVRPRVRDGAIESDGSTVLGVNAKAALRHCSKLRACSTLRIDQTWRHVWNCSLPGAKKSGTVARK